MKIAYGTKYELERFVRHEEFREQEITETREKIAELKKRNYELEFKLDVTQEKLNLERARMREVKAAFPSSPPTSREDLSCLMQEAEERLRSASCIVAPFEGDWYLQKHYYEGTP